ncbi:MAG: cysteine--tRNA ligase, partial [Methylomarinum sp.]|nr:cysteine--tRNA ligase [Methylomarinum sp.]
GERVGIDTAKQDPLDFVLWKMVKPDEPSWDSPWGKGRPGWHIECSAMSTCCLGNHFDIHGGGMDLQFPHHENEIAQTEGATGEKFVNLWMHNDFVRVDEEKMSKSLGNFFTVRDVLKKYDPEVVRFFVLTSHYRSPLNYSDKQLDDAVSALTRLYTALRGVNVVEGGPVDADYEQRFKEAMDDDFNTPVALSVLFDCARELNKIKEVDADKSVVLALTLKSLAGFLGLLQRDSAKALKEGFRYIKASGSSVIDISASAEGSVMLSDGKIEQQVNARLEAKQNKDWAAADQIRDELKAQGVVLEDVQGGTNWRRE